MTAVLEQPKTELTLVQRAAVALGTAEHELALRALVKQSASIIEVKNGAGRDECHAAYMRLKNSRISVEKASKSATEDAKAFSKAVTTEERRLIAITQAEEDRLQALRDAWDAEVEAEKARRVAAERARVESIQSMIQKIRNVPATLIGKNAAQISEWLAAENPDKNFDFMEFSDQAADAMAESLIAARDLLSKTQAAEAEAARALAERQAEDERRAAEAALLLRQREELARKQEALDRDRAEQAAHAAEQQRIANEAAAVEAARVKKAHDGAQAELKAQQDAFAAEQAAAREETARQAAEAKALIDEAARLRRAAEDVAVAETQWIADAAPTIAQAQPEPEAPFTPAAPAAFPFPGSEAYAKSESPPTLTVGMICTRLDPLKRGLTVSADFLRSLGFEPAESKGAAKLYRDSQFPEICAALIAHIEAVSSQRMAA